MTDIDRPFDSLALPRFCGVATFMRLPQAASADGLDVAVRGLPSDNGSPFRTGARFGPQVIRGASVMLRPINPYRGNIDVFSALRVADLGDAAVVPGYMPATLSHLEAAVHQVVDAGACSCCLEATTASASQACVQLRARIARWRWCISTRTATHGTPISAVNGTAPALRSAARWRRGW